MNVVFMGTSDFAVPALRALAAADSFTVKLVLTRPDAASGRGKALLPSPVRAAATELGIPVITPLNLTADPEALSLIAATEPDFLVVAAYGMLLPQQLLDLPRYGSINIHASLLPRWRGAAPIQRALLAGDEKSGVSIMRMEASLDTGPVCSVATTPLTGKNAQQLSAELAELGAELLLEALPRIVDGSIFWQTQPQEGVTYANKIKKSELDLSPDSSATINIRKVLASTPQAPARCVLGERPVTILAATPTAETLSPGTAYYKDGQLILATAEGSFAVTSLKPDGKRAMTAPAFAAGYKPLQTPIPWSDLKR
ncbi:MAG: methionyl-tRNA formyltransferase [Coriobacteriia bacterium]|nr:methionyl-tRNA formyltransferase [Coriobacteriia bacterium]